MSDDGWNHIGGGVEIRVIVGENPFGPIVEARGPILKTVWTSDDDAPQNDESPDQ